MQLRRARAGSGSAAVLGAQGPRSLDAGRGPSVLLVPPIRALACSEDRFSGCGVGGLSDRRFRFAQVMRDLLERTCESLDRHHSQRSASIILASSSGR